MVLMNLIVIYTFIKVPKNGKKEKYMLHCRSANHSCTKIEVSL